MRKCRFNVDWSDPINFQSRYPAHLRFLSRLAESQALLDVRSGSAHAALQPVELILDMSKAAQAEPTMIPVFTRYQLIWVAANALSDVAQDSPICEADDRLLAAAFAAIDLRDSLTNALEGDRASGIIVFQQIRGGKFPYLFGDQKTSRSVQSAYRSFPFNSVLDNDESYFLAEMRYRIDRCQKPYRVIAREETDGEPREPKYAMFSTLLLSPGDSVASSRDRAIANLSGSRIFLGILAYRDHFGSYPAKLGDLKQVKWQLPEDPFSGKPFIYRTQGKGFILYSIGDDLKDNGGIEPTDKRPGDIIWKLGR